MSPANIALRAYCVAVGTAMIPVGQTVYGTGKVTQGAGQTISAVANGEYKNVEEAATKLVKVVDTIEPDPELAKKYDEKYQKFVKIYPTVKNLFSEIL